MINKIEIIVKIIKIFCSFWFVFFLLFLEAIIRGRKIVKKYAEDEESESPPEGSLIKKTNIPTRIKVEITPIINHFLSNFIRKSFSLIIYVYSTV